MGEPVHTGHPCSRSTHDEACRVPHSLMPKFVVLCHKLAPWQWPVDTHGHFQPMGEPVHPANAGGSRPTPSGQTRGVGGGGLTDALLAVRQVLQLAATAHRSSRHSGAAANDLRSFLTSTHGGITLIRDFRKVSKNFSMLLILDAILTLDLYVEMIYTVILN